MAADPDWSGLDLAFRSGSRRSTDDALFEPEPLARLLAVRRNELTELMTGEKD